MIGSPLRRSVADRAANSYGENRRRRQTSVGETQKRVAPFARSTGQIQGHHADAGLDTGRPSPVRNACFFWVSFPVASHAGLQRQRIGLIASSPARSRATRHSRVWNGRWRSGGRRPSVQRPTSAADTCVGEVGRDGTGRRGTGRRETAQDGWDGMRGHGTGRDRTGEEQVRDETERGRDETERTEGNKKVAWNEKGG